MSLCPSFFPLSYSLILLATCWCLSSFFRISYRSCFGVFFWSSVLNLPSPLLFLPAGRVIALLISTNYLSIFWKSLSVVSWKLLLPILLALLSPFSLRMIFFSFSASGKLLWCSKLCGGSLFYSRKGFFSPGQKRKSKREIFDGD